MTLNKNIRAIFCGTLSALLSFVIVFNLSYNAFHIQHEKHHHASEQTCSENEESDACHRFLVHHEKSSACSGQHEHFSEKADDCFICHFYKNQQQVIKPKYDVYFIAKTKRNIVSKTEIHFESSDLIYSFLRGPPAIS